MPTKPSTTHRPQHEQAQQRRLRAGLLLAGALLGWDARTVARFAEGVTGRPLSRCERGELRRVLEAYAHARSPCAGRPGTPAGRRLS
jgi:hypothetical protein